MGSSLALAAAAAALAFQVAPGPSAPIDPSGPWTAEISEGICLVGRSYGAGGQPPTLGFRQVPNAEDFEIGLWIADSSQKPARGIARLRLDRSASVEAPYIRGPVAIKGMHLIWIAAKRPDLAALPVSKEIEIDAGAYQARFNLKNVKGALKALADCERDLLVRWGMDPAVLASLASPPRGQLARFFTTSDYPRDALAMRKEGTAGVRFWVNTDGTLSDCRVVASSGSPLIDGRTCGILKKRARLEPARRSDGRPVASISFARIRWEIARW